MHRLCIAPNRYHTPQRFQIEQSSDVTEPDAVPHHECLELCRTCVALLTGNSGFAHGSELPHSISRTINNATRRVSQLSAILLRQEQAGEIAKSQLPCVCMPMALVQTYRAHLITCPLHPNIVLTSLASYEELPGDRLAGTGNPCQAIRPVWGPCRSALRR